MLSSFLGWISSVELACRAIIGYRILVVKACYGGRASRSDYDDDNGDPLARSTWHAGHLRPIQRSTPGRSSRAEKFGDARGLLRVNVFQDFEQRMRVVTFQRSTRELGELVAQFEICHR